MTQEERDIKAELKNISAFLLSGFLANNSVTRKLKSPETKKKVYNELVIDSVNLAIDLSNVVNKLVLHRTPAPGESPEAPPVPKSDEPVLPGLDDTLPVPEDVENSEAPAQPETPAETPPES